MAYAETTTVPVERSISEITGLAKKAGAQRIAQAKEPDRFSVQFTIQERTVRFRVTLPALDAMPTRDGRGVMLTAQQRRAKMEQAHRQRARALMLVIKAKLENGVETFEQAFLPNVVLADGSTVYERVAGPIAEEYRVGAVQQLLLSGPAGA